MSQTMSAPDPSAPADPSAASPADAGPNVLVSVTEADDGSYMVYAGEAPDDDQGASSASGIH